MGGGGERGLRGEKGTFQAKEAVFTVFQRSCKDDPLHGAVSYSCVCLGSVDQAWKENMAWT